MKDPRYKQLAEVLIGHSTRLRSGEKVLIEAFDCPPDFIIELVRAAKVRDAIPFVTLRDNRVLRAIVQTLPEEGFKQWGEFDSVLMKEMQAYIGVRGSYNITEMSDLESEQMDWYKTHYVKPVHFDIRVPQTRWVVLRFPTPSMAQQANMSSEAFEDFYFRVCTLDYAKMSQRMGALQERMQSTDRVHITGPDTDLEFSIKNIPCIPCGGEHNIPDGECFTAPVRDSVNGHIRFNTATIYEGTVFSDIRLEFENGKIIKATADKTDKLNRILDTDEGARYIGEFAIGFNPHITEPMLDILFDEKIAGSFHFTPGQAYEEADNGNKSKIHWDMVLIQRPEYGGGEIRFDGELIRKDGLFVTDDLNPLNPDQLI